MLHPETYSEGEGQAEDDNLEEDRRMGARNQVLRPALRSQQLVPSWGLGPRCSLCLGHSSGASGGRAFLFKDQPRCPLLGKAFPDHPVSHCPSRALTTICSLILVNLSAVCLSPGEYTLREHRDLVCPATAAFPAPRTVSGTNQFLSQASDS